MDRVNEHVSALKTGAVAQSCTPCVRPENERSFQCKFEESQKCLHREIANEITQLGDLVTRTANAASYHHSYIVLDDKEYALNVLESGSDSWVAGIASLKILSKTFKDSCAVFFSTREFQECSACTEARGDSQSRLARLETGLSRSVNQEPGWRGGLIGVDYEYGGDQAGGVTGVLCHALC